MSRQRVSMPNEASSANPHPQQSMQDIHRTNSIQSIRSSVHSVPDIQLTAKPHAFAGAVLNPKHARELTPKTVLTITHTLGLHALDNANSYAVSGPNSNSAESSGGYSRNSDNEAGNVRTATTEDEAKVQYTVWITEAWRVLGWAEPSAALFWEMATMYYTLHVAARSIEIEETDLPDVEVDDGHWSIQRTLSHTIPPILSCESSESMNSVENRKKDEFGKKGEPDSPNSGFNSATNANKKGPSSANEKKHSHINKASNASAKELPVWLVGMFLLLHCEEEAFWRNVSGEDEQRFDALMAKQQAPSGFGEILGKGVDFNMLLMNPSLSSRSQYHAGSLDHSNGTSYLLRHLRKFLLLACVPHNADALVALYTLALSECQHDEEYMVRQHGSSRNNPYSTRDPDVILERHEDEHGKIGLDVRMTVEDLERLNLVFQAPSGGAINNAPLFISDVMPQEELAVYGGISVEEVEREIIRHLERELNGNEKHSIEEKEDVETTAKDISKLSIIDQKEGEKSRGDSSMHSHNDDDDDDDYNKELTYTKVRGSTILLKPNNHTEGAVKVTNPHTGTTTNGRLHDVHVSGCSDSHMYLLQPFEHATISACSGCTIVVGAVAGLLHVVDCERTTITSAARRVLVSNCYDVTHNIFTPSPSLLVGDNRNCKFAPYNTYYDGLREDLLATGLAAAVVSSDNQIVSSPLYGPALQCASNKWKQPVELSKLSDLLQAQSIAPRSSSPTPGLDGTTEDAVKIPTLVPASEFQVLFVPFLSEATQERRARQDAAAEDITIQTASSGEDNTSTPGKNDIGSIYMHNLADVLQLSPFRLPTEYERRAMVKADRMKSLQTTIETDLSLEQQIRLEEELNSGFRDWLVTSGNLRQVLDLVHLERKEAKADDHN